MMNAVKATNSAEEVVDALFAVALTIGTYLGAKRLPQWSLRFSIRTALLCVATCATALDFRYILFATRYMPEFPAFAVVLIGVVLSLVGMVSFAHRMSRYLARGMHWD